MAGNAPVLRLSSVSKSFGGLNVLTGLSLDVGDNEVLGILGPNGAGKSTALQRHRRSSPSNLRRRHLQGTGYHAIASLEPMPGGNSADLSDTKTVQPHECERKRLGGWSPWRRTLG